jgi:hypothetical protein
MFSQELIKVTNIYSTIVIFSVFLSAVGLVLGIAAILKSSSRKGVISTGLLLNTIAIIALLRNIN